MNYRFLQSVTLLSTIDVYERSQIADALVPETFAMGQSICNLHASSA